MAGQQHRSELAPVLRLSPSRHTILLSLATCCAILGAIAHSDRASDPAIRAPSWLCSSCRPCFDIALTHLRMRMSPQILQGASPRPICTRENDGELMPPVFISACRSMHRPPPPEILRSVAQPTLRPEVLLTRQVRRARALSCMSTCRDMCYSICPVSRLWCSPIGCMYRTVCSSLVSYWHTYLHV